MLKDKDLQNLLCKNLAAIQKWTEIILISIVEMYKFEDLGSWA